MYTGRMMGGQIPTGLAGSPIYNLGEVSESGYGPYLGNLFDDIARVAQEVGVASGELAKVAAGQAKIATVPTDRATLTFPVPGSPVATSISLLPLALGAGALLWFAMRKRR